MVVHHGAPLCEGICCHDPQEPALPNAGTASDQDLGRPLLVLVVKEYFADNLSQSPCGFPGDNEGLTHERQLLSHVPHLHATSKGFRLARSVDERLHELVGVFHWSA